MKILSKLVLSISLILLSSCEQEIASEQGVNSSLAVKTSAIIIGEEDNRAEIETFDNSIASLVAPSGSSTCSTTIVGPRHVITAAHCLYDEKSDRFRKDRYIIPAYNLSGSKKPIQRFFIKKIFIPHSYLELTKGKSSVPQKAFAHDIALVELYDLPGNEAFAEQTKSVPLEVFNRDFHMKDDSVVLKAYHGDLKHATPYKQEGCRFDVMYNQGKDIGHTCDNYKGSSGASLQIRGNIVAINTGEFASDHNSGTPITESFRDALEAAIDEKDQDVFKEISIEQTPFIGIDVLNNCKEDILIAFKYKNLAGGWVFDGHYRVGAGKLFISPVQSSNDVIFYQAQTLNRSLTWEGNHHAYSNTDQLFKMIELDIEPRFYDERIKFICD